MIKVTNSLLTLTQHTTLVPILYSIGLYALCLRVVPIGIIDIEDQWHTDDGHILDMDGWEL